MILIDSKTRLPLKVGDKVKTFRGEPGKLLAVYPPRSIASSGHVSVRLDKEAPEQFWNNYWNAVVIGAEFVEEAE